MMPTLPFDSGTFLVSHSMVSQVSVEWSTGVGLSALPLSGRFIT